MGTGHTKAGASNPPASAAASGGVSCNASRTSAAPGLGPTFTPTGPYPADCATFNQFGFHVPFVAVSPFAKPPSGAFVDHPAR